MKDPFVIYYTATELSRLFLFILDSHLEMGLDMSIVEVVSQLIILRPLQTSGLFSLSGNASLNALIEIEGISGASSKIYHILHDTS